MIRAYMNHDQVVGFAHQYPRGLLPPGDASRVPASKTFELPSVSTYAKLRRRLEADWVPEMQHILGSRNALAPGHLGRRLPVRPEDNAGEDTFVLCEINVSSTFAFPEFAMPTVAAAALERIERRAHDVPHAPGDRP